MIRSFNHLALLAAMVSSSAALANETGTYCGGDQLVAYLCGGGRPDGSWNEVDGGGCTAKVVGQCSVTNDQLPVFDYDQYGAINGDVAAAGVDRLQHWKMYGKAEGRMSSRAFDVKRYVDQNPDLQGAFGTNWTAALDHYRDYGQHEGRVTIGNPTSDPARPNLRVMAGNSDAGDFPALQDGGWKAAIMRIGPGKWTESQINLDTHLDTARVTGLPNAYRLGPGATIKGPPQDPVAGKTGFYGVQQYGSQFGLSIDTRVAKGKLDEYADWVKANGKGDAGLGTITIGRSWLSNWYTPGPGQVSAPRPWRDGQVLKSSMSLRIPFAGGEGPSGPSNNGSQVVDYFFLHDTVGGGSLALGMVMFDTRQSAASLYINEPNSYSFNIFNIPMTRGYADQGYFTMPSWSAEFTSQTHSETRPRVYTYTRANIQKIINEAIAKGHTGLTNNPDNYEVTDYVFNPETFSDKDPNTLRMTGNGWIGLSGNFSENGPAAN